MDETDLGETDLGELVEVEDSRSKASDQDLYMSSCEDLEVRWWKLSSLLKRCWASQESSLSPAAPQGWLCLSSPRWPGPPTWPRLSALTPGVPSSACSTLALHLVGAFNPREVACHMHRALFRLWDSNKQPSTASLGPPSKVGCPSKVV